MEGEGAREVAPHADGYRRGDAAWRSSRFSGIRLLWSGERLSQEHAKALYCHSSEVRGAAGACVFQASRTSAWMFTGPCVRQTRERLTFLICVSRGLSGPSSRAASFRYFFMGWYLWCATVNWPSRIVHAVSACQCHRKRCLVQCSLDWLSQGRWRSSSRNALSVSSGLALVDWCTFLYNQMTVSVFFRGAGDHCGSLVQ